MSYLIIADWDDNFHPIRTNTKETEADAIELVDKLKHNMPPGLAAPNAFHVLNPDVEFKHIVVDPVTKTITVDQSGSTLDAVTKAFEQKKSEIKSAMYDRLEQGISWQLDDGSPENTVSLNDEMHNFLVRQLALMQAGRTNPHNGFVRSNGVSFNIDDTGLNELCLFAGLWGDSISDIRISQTIELQETAFPAMPTGTELATVQAYDPGSIDWIVIWDTEDALNGWTDSKLTQNV